MQPAENTASPPAVAVSIEDGVATVLLEPFTAEMTAETKGALLAADRVRVFIDASIATNTRPGFGPVKSTDYPADTLGFLISNANLICGMVSDCGPGASLAEIEKMFARFDSEEVENSRWAIRLFTDEPWELGEHVSLYRPSAAT
jgi:hypothetical protein